MCSWAAFFICHQSASTTSTTTSTRNQLSLRFCDDQANSGPEDGLDATLEGGERERERERESQSDRQTDREEKEENEERDKQK
jgi:hypothetical protein